MKSMTKAILTLALAAAFCLVPLAKADPVSMVLTGLGNGTVAGTTMGGVYVGPYQSNFGLVVCADFFIHSQLNKPWDANVSYNGGDLSDTRQAALEVPAQQYSAQQRYNQAAYLVEQLLAAYAANNAVLQRQLSFAVWGIFNDTVFGLMTNLTDRAKAIEYANYAKTNYTNVLNTSLVIYTPTAVAAGTPLSPPQEFLAIRTPEGSVTILWGVQMLAAIGFVVFFRRRMVQRGV